MFKHIVMTRFNLATPGNEFTLRTQPGWLESRFDLFERFCLPSMAAQTERNFSWIIYFDIDTPPAFKERIESLRAIFPFVPYYTGLFPGTGWRDSVTETFTLDTPLLLTTRLDNDDALSRDFVARLHAAVAENDHLPGAYNFSNGLIRSGQALYGLTHESNAFFSLLEPVSPTLRTAPSIRHMEIAQFGPVSQIDGPATWMQIIHETNVSNKVRGIRLSPARVAVSERFIGAAGRDMPDVADWRCQVENLSLGAMRGLRDHAIRILRQRKSASH